MDTHSCYLQIGESVIDAVLGDEAVILNVESGVYFGLDPVGTRIWELLVPGTTEDKIVTQLLDEYQVEPAQVRADVRQFVQALRAKELVREVNE